MGESSFAFSLGCQMLLGARKDIGRSLMKKFAKYAALPVAALLAVSLTACGDDDADTTTVVTTTVASETSTVNQIVMTTNEEAVAAVKAVQASRAGKIVSVDRDDRNQRWEVDVMDGNKVITLLVDYEGKVVDNQYAVETLDADDQRELTGTALPVEGLIVQHSPKDSVLDEAELDYENNRLVWQLSYDNVQDEEVAEVTLDAATGDVLKHEKKDPKSDD